MTNSTKEFLSTPEGGRFLKSEYETKSTIQIANSLEASPRLISYYMDLHGIPRRSLKQAKALSVEQGRSKHPTKGRPRDEFEKKAIANGVRKSKARASEEEKEQWGIRGKAIWNNLSEEVRKAFATYSTSSVAKANLSAGRLKVFLKRALSEYGWKVRMNGVINGIAIDILSEQERIAIFIDGVKHHIAASGQENLEKIQAEDSKANSALVQLGYRVIRIKCLTPFLNDSQKFDSAVAIASISESDIPRVTYLNVEDYA